MGGVVISEVYGKGKGEYFKTTSRPVGVQIKINTMIYFKFKLQLNLEITQITFL